MPVQPMTSPHISRALGSPQLHVTVLRGPSHSGCPSTCGSLGLSLFLIVQRHHVKGR